MYTLEKIKNEKLKEFLKTYSHFQTLSDEEKQAYLKKMIELPDEKQTEVFEFLELEDAKAKLEMLKQLTQHVKQFDKKVTNYISQSHENKSEQAEEKEMNKIINNI